MVYHWKDGAREKADAQKVGEELEGIGYCDADSVVNAARKSKGELHKCFEWDDAVAGHEYRKEQARYVLRMLVTPVDVEAVDGDPPQVMMRVYESVRFVADDGSPEATMAYIPTREALEDPVMREQVRERLRNTIGQAEATARIYGFVVVSGKLKDAKRLLEV